MQEHGNLLVDKIVNGPFGQNCYAVADATTRQALIIDPGDDEDLILERVRTLDWRVIEIVATHAHIDHVGAVAPLKRTLGVPFALHAAEKDWLDNLPAQASMFGLPHKEIPDIERSLGGGEQGMLGELTYQIRNTPGHSPGGCCLYFPEAAVIFVGDTLFSSGIGRTDLPGGDSATLLRSIERELLSLDDDVVVYSGHGPDTTIGAERRGNPFLRGGPFED